MAQIRIASFNLENFDDTPELTPTLAERIAVMRPQLMRLNADIVCLQEVHGQKVSDEPRRLLALKKLLEHTSYTDYNIVSTQTADGTQVYDERNLVILSRFNIADHGQYKHHYIKAPFYKKVTAATPAEHATKITWERPILHAKITLPNYKTLHVINLHLKSKIPTDIDGQKIDTYTWKSASGWAEGYFLSSLKRVGQALEARMLIDTVFDEDAEAFIVCCGDFNSTSDNVPVQAIRGDVENTGNGKLANRVLIPCEKSVPKSSRYSLFHQGKGEMLDHLLVSRSLLSCYSHTEIHNEILHDESIAFAVDKKYPESDHAPVIAQFDIS